MVSRDPKPKTFHRFRFPALHLFRWTFFLPYLHIHHLRIILTLLSMAFDQSDTETSPKKNPSIIDPTSNSRSPFYVHHCENIGAILIAPPLDDNNYHNWIKSMPHAFTSKNNIGFINSSLQWPSAINSNFDVW